jgi:hypothetical protein
MFAEFLHHQIYNLYAKQGNFAAFAETRPMVSMHVQTCRELGDLCGTSGILSGGGGGRGIFGDFWLLGPDKDSSSLGPEASWLKNSFAKNTPHVWLK